MLSLLNNYSLTEITIFIVTLAFAIKGIVDFCDWAKKRIKEPIDKTYSEKEVRTKMLNTLESHNQQIEKMSKAIDILIASDKDDIKSWITEKYHYFCYELGYIDDYNYQCIEARYKHYKEEDGNTFIDSFMEDIRALPKISVINKQENK